MYVGCKKPHFSLFLLVIFSLFVLSCDGNPTSNTGSQIDPPVNSDSTAPVVTGLSDDTTYALSKTWTWGCNETCTYRYVIDTNPITAPSGSYTGVFSATQSSGTGDYYIHVQARDSAGNESAVMHALAKLDNDGPAYTGVPDVSADDATLSKATTVNWSAGSLSDNASGLASIEVAIGYDADSFNGLETNEIDNVLAWAAIPSALTLSPEQYQVSNGVDGFSLSLVTLREYFTSLRITDSLGNTTVVTSAAWKVAVPYGISNNALWLDAAQASTLFQDSACTTAATTNGQPVGCWRDRSGNNFNATMSTALQRPSYSTALGFSSISFDGSNDLYDNAHSYTARTVYIVYRMDSTLQQTSDLAQLWGQYSRGHVAPDGRDTGFFSFDGNAGSTASYSMNGNNLAAGGTGSKTQPWVYNQLQMTTTSFNSNINITQQVLGSLYPNFAVGVHQLGGQISEILVFSNTHTTGTNDLVEGYLACKWGLQGSLPAGHPYKSTCP